MKNAERICSLRIFLSMNDLKWLWDKTEEWVAKKFANRGTSIELYADMMIQRYATLYVDLYKAQRTV